MGGAPGSVDEPILPEAKSSMSALDIEGGSFPQEQMGKLTLPNLTVDGGSGA
jgi:hypothetical protein